MKKILIISLFIFGCNLNGRNNKILKSEDSVTVINYGSIRMVAIADTFGNLTVIDSLETIKALIRVLTDKK